VQTLSRSALQLVGIGWLSDAFVTLPGYFESYL
jgi:hypothetical protein